MKTKSPTIIFGRVSLFFALCFLLKTVDMMSQYKQFSNKKNCKNKEIEIYFIILQYNLKHQMVSGHNTARNAPIQYLIVTETGQLKIWRQGLQYKAGIYTTISPLYRKIWALRPYSGCTICSSLLLRMLEVEVIHKTKRELQSGPLDNKLKDNT